MEHNNKLSSADSQLVIKEAIRKIALGRSIDRINMSPSGTGGVGTARMIHGYVAKVHDNPSDEEFEEYGGTIDVGEFPDETTSTTQIIHKGVLLAGLKDNSGGFLIIPTLFSDVTIVSDAATRYMYVLNYSHADILQLNSHHETTIGVKETEELDPTDNDSPDYDQLEKTGNETVTRYTATTIDTTAKNEKGKESVIHIEPEKISQKIEGATISHTAGKIENKVEKSTVSQTSDKINQTVGSTTVTVTDQKVTLGNENATEPLVLGNQLVQLMMEFITECTKIMTPTMLGTMPAINAPNFAPLMSKLQAFLSQTSFTK